MRLRKGSKLQSWKPSVREVPPLPQGPPWTRFSQKVIWTEKGAPPPLLTDGNHNCSPKTALSTQKHYIWEKIWKGSFLSGRVGMPLPSQQTVFVTDLWTPPLLPPSPLQHTIQPECASLWCIITDISNISTVRFDKKNSWHRQCQLTQWVSTKSICPCCIVIMCTYLFIHPQPVHSWGGCA